MAHTKTEFKWFTIQQYKSEEEYLRKMHNNGWKLSHIGFPGFYHFTECKPEDIVYQLDYNLEGTANKSEYIQMFSDFGWEYLFDYVGYSYFRKPVEQMNGKEEIFCDDESRLEMMKRVFKGRVTPLLIIFFTIIIPQLFMQTLHLESGSLHKGLGIAYLILFLIYISIFISFGFQFFSYEKKIRKPDKAFKAKYIALSVATAVLCVLTALGMARLCGARESKYTINTLSNQYSIGAEYLNDTLNHEIMLKEGEYLDANFVVEDGELYVDICSEAGNFIFEKTISESSSYTLVVPETGNYEISITGKEAEGSLSFQIR